MTPGHASALLAFIATVDDRFTLTDPALAEARVRAWAVILSDVEPSFAMDHVRRYYARVGQPRVTPGEVRSAWVGHLRHQDARERPAYSPGVRPPAGLREYLRQAVAAAQAGRDPGEVPVPVGRGLSPEADVASRRCRHWRGCACDHTRCRDGWLDTEDRIVNALGKGYPAVKACPHCRDAALMAAELATPVRGRRR